MMGNSPLELHSANSANFGRSQTLSLASRPKFAENYESQIENPSVVVAFSHESKKNRHCEANHRFAEAIHTNSSLRDSTTPNRGNPNKIK